MASHINTFNPAKKYAEEELLQLVSAHKAARLTSKLGAINIQEASKLSSDFRVLARFNALKERLVVQQTLLNEIEATVRLNKVKMDIGLVEEVKEHFEGLEVDLVERED